MRVSTKVVIAIETGEVLERESYLYAGAVELCRGEDKSTAAAADAERAKQDAMNAQLFTQQQQARRGLSAKFEDLYKNAGSGPDAEAAAASYGSAADQLARRAARTHNSAGVIEGQDELARGKAQTQSDIVRKNELAAVQGEAGIYGLDQNMLARTLGIPVEYLQVRQRAMEPKNTGGFWSSFANSAGSGLGNLVTGQ